MSDLSSRSHLAITHLAHQQLRIDALHIEQGQAWCIINKNGSYEDQLLALFDHELPESCAEQCDLPTHSAVISFQSLQQIYQRELDIDETDMRDEIDLGTPVQDFLPKEQHQHPLIDTLNMRHKMTTGFRQLSTGESRKVQILQAVLEGANFIVLENPFDSLDSQSNQQLEHSLQLLQQQGISLVMLLNNQQDIPDWIEHFACLHAGQLTLLNDATRADDIQQFFAVEQHEIDWPAAQTPLEDYQHEFLCELKNCTVTFGGKDVFRDLSVLIKPLEHTLITGANGSGKSTLLQLITGDCPQCFSNQVTVFGHRRGSGESIWDIKQHIGIISSDLHRSYRVSCNAITAVVSGFHDSIGLYQSVSEGQIELARHWLAMVGLSAQENTPLQQLSHGEQRLVLIARALVKSPLLIIMDEPTQGLDETNRDLVLRFVNKLASNKHTTILYVSHREDEHLPLFRHRVAL